MQQFNGVQGQSLMDVCLNTYGSLDFFFKLLRDNGIASANSTVITGQVFIWDDSLVQNQQVNQAYAASGIIYATEIGASQQTSGDAIITEDGFFIISETGGNVIEQ
jgi:hypothetical protein